MQNQQQRAECPADGKMGVVGGAMVLLSTGIGTGVLVLPRSMAAVGFAPMTFALFVASLTSAFSTWTLFLAVARFRRAAQRRISAEHHHPPAYPSAVGLGERLVAASGEAEAREPQGLATLPPKSRAESIDEPSGTTFEISDALPNAMGPSYGELVAASLPSWCSILLNILVIIYGLGAVTTYFLFVSDFLHLLTFWPAQVNDNLTVVLMAILVFPLSMQENVSALTKLAPASLIALVLMSLAIWFRLPVAIANRVAPVQSVADLERLPAVSCVASFAFVWHTNCVGVARELNNPTWGRCAAVALGGSQLLFVVYLLIAVGGYLSFGEAVFHQQSIVNMYADEDPIFIVVRLALVFGLLITTPLNYYPIREACTTLIKIIKPDFELNPATRITLSFGLVAVTVFFAIEFPHVVQVITMLGGTLVTFIAIVFPAFVARMVLAKGQWLIVLVVSLPLAVFLNISALGFIGKPS